MGAGTTAEPEEAGAADVLRAWALDEGLKHRVMSDPVLAPLARRVARRYTAGETVADAVAAASAGLARGHLPSIEYAGESVRDPDEAAAETQVFLDLVDAVRAAGLPSTVSLDLSHVGAVVDPEVGLRHARRIAAASEGLGTALMVSAEGSERTDLVLDLYDDLAGSFPHVGITLQARLHRTPADLERVLRHPGPVRLVKGAFAEPVDVALPRESPDLPAAYLALVDRLVEAAHPFAVATHDETLVRSVLDRHPDAMRADGVEVEMLHGLGTELLDALHADGYRTREYVVFGDQWWLYVLNRIAERPERVYRALTDLGAR